MRKYSPWLVAMLVLAMALPAISWVSSSSLQPVSDHAASLPAAAPEYSESELFDRHAEGIYEKTGLPASGLDEEVFKKALTGYYNLRKTNLISPELQILSIIDFDKRSTEKRLWVLDLENHKLLFNTWVAHGQGSGGDMATSFSNRPNSHQSSLGFYVTSETYSGKHGFSMRLDGLDKGFNTNARNRAIVIHGASYVSQAFINRTGRLGRSHGCPALPAELTKTIINTIKGNTCLFIHGSAQEYTSGYLDQQGAIAGLVSAGNSLQAQL